MPPPLICPPPHLSAPFLSVPDPSPPDFSSTILSLSKPSPPKPSPPCGFEGNPDIYGVGVRIGSYMLALAAWYANYFVVSEARKLRPTNLLYILALQMCTSFYTSNPSKVYALEVFIVLTFLLCIGFIATSNAQTRYSTRLLPTTRLYLVTHKGLTVFTLWFGFWFWFAGCCGYKVQNCGTFIWLVVKVNLYDRSVFKMISALYFPISVWYPIQLMATSLFTLTLLKSRMTWVAFTRELHFKTVKDIILKIPGVFFSFAIGDMREVLGTFTRISHEDGLLGRSIQAFEKTREVENFIDEILSPYTNIGSRNLALIADTNTGSWRDPHAVIRKVGSYIDWPVLKIAMARCPADLPITEAWPIAYGVMDHARILRIDKKYMQDIVDAAFRARTSYPRDFCKWVDTAYKVRIYQLPLKSRLGWRTQAVIGILLLIFLVIEVEKTLRYNNVSGINDFNSFGQLLAFFVGVFGLMNVLCQKLRDGIAGIEEKDKKLEQSPFDNAIDDYLVWKGCTQTCSSTL